MLRLGDLAALEGDEGVLALDGKELLDRAEIEKVLGSTRRACAGRAGSAGEARVCPNEPRPSLVAYAGWPPGCLGLLLLGCLCAWLGGVGAGCMRYLVEAAEEGVGYNGIHDVEQDQFGGGGSRCRHDEAGGGGQDRHGWRHALVRPRHLNLGPCDLATSTFGGTTTAPRRREEFAGGASSLLDNSDSTFHLNALGRGLRERVI